MDYLEALKRLDETDAEISAAVRSRVESLRQLLGECMFVVEFFMPEAEGNDFAKLSDLYHRIRKAVE